jgi:hypothetical protein
MIRSYRPARRPLPRAAVAERGTECRSNTSVPIPRDSLRRRNRQLRAVERRKGRRGAVDALNHRYAFRRDNRWRCSFRLTRNPGKSRREIRREIPVTQPCLIRPESGTGNEPPVSRFGQEREAGSRLAANRDIGATLPCQCELSTELVCTLVKCSESGTILGWMLP